MARNPLRLIARRKHMACAYCGRTKPWPESFVNRTEACCFTCWLRQHPEHLEPMRVALWEISAEQKPTGP